MKFYVSLPITGQPIEKAKRTAEAAKALLASMGFKAITPFDVCPEPNLRYSQYMGRDIEALLECDAVYFCPGWADSKGCLLEHQAAAIYGKAIFPQSAINLPNNKHDEKAR